MLVKYLRTRGIIGSSLSRHAFPQICGDSICELSAERQASGRRQFNGHTTPGQGFLKTFMQRWPSPRECRAGTIVEAHARKGRPKVMAHWFANLLLLYRDLGVWSSLQVWIMDKALVKAREPARNSRMSIIEPVNSLKTGVIMPDFASSVGACTAAFTV